VSVRGVTTSLSAWWAVMEIMVVAMSGRHNSVAPDGPSADTPESYSIRVLVRGMDEPEGW